MKVYELIQELAKYDADQEVEVNVYTNNLSLAGTANNSCEIGEYVDIDAEFDEYVSDIEVDGYEKLTREKIVRIMVQI